MRQAPQETRTYHIVAVTAQRRRLFQVTATAELMQQTLFHYHRQSKFLLHAFVIMPDHIHALITPAPEVSLEKAVQFIKGGFSFRFKTKLDVWASSFNETQMQTSGQFKECKLYIEHNPVRRRITHSANQYPYSSAGPYPTDPIPLHFQG